jgi:beta-glucanase (GH16 family)
MRFLQKGAGGNVLNPIQSAKITTATTFNFQYGRVEVVAKLPKGDWLWPAIWMLPARNEYGMWPASGEFRLSLVIKVGLPPF